MSFVAAADELGVSTAFVTKRIKAVEALLGAKLLNRRTRRVAVTEDGERALYWGQRILAHGPDRLWQAVLSLSASRPVEPVCTRSLARAGRLQGCCAGRLTNALGPSPTIQAAVGFALLDLLPNKGTC